jgi:DNA-binding transcriptional LysR family regulator
MHTMDIKWDDLHTFLSVSRSGSFLGAARELAVEHTPIARRVTRLERSLCNTLRHRGRRGVTLTPFGEALVEVLARTEGEVLAAVRVATEQDPASAVRSGSPPPRSSRWPSCVVGSPGTRSATRRSTSRS